MKVTRRLYYSLSVTPVIDSPVMICLLCLPSLVLRQERRLTDPPRMLSLIASFIFASQGGHEMAQLIVRNLDPELVRQLKSRAAQHGCSMEAEHREILRQALQGSALEETLKALLLAMPPVGDDADFTRLPDQGREVEV